MMIMIVMEYIYVCMYNTMTCYIVVIIFTVHII